MQHILIMSIFFSLPGSSGSSPPFLPTVLHFSLFVSLKRISKIQESNLFWPAGQLLLDVVPALECVNILLSLKET